MIWAINPSSLISSSPHTVLASRFPSRSCFSSSVSFSLSIVLLARSSRLSSRLIVLLLRLVSLHRRLLSVSFIVSVIYYPRPLIYPFIIPSLPFPIAPILPHRLIASPYPATLSISSPPSPLPDGKIELAQTARSFRHRHQPNRIPRREATGTRARHHDMRMTSRRPFPWP